MQVGGVFVRIRLDRCSTEFLDALANMMHVIDHADPALLEESIGEARDRLRSALDANPYSFDTVEE